MSACLLGESTVFYAFSHFLYTVEQNQKEVIAAKFFSQQIITYIHSFKKSCIVAIVQKLLVILVGGFRQEEVRLSDVGDIQDIKIDKDCVLWWWGRASSSSISREQVFAEGNQKD